MTVEDIGLQIAGGSALLGVSFAIAPPLLNIALPGGVTTEGDLRVYAQGTLSVYLPFRPIIKDIDTSLFPTLGLSVSTTDVFRPAPAVNVDFNITELKSGVLVCPFLVTCAAALVVQSHAEHASK